MNISKFYSWLTPKLSSISTNQQLQNEVGRNLDELHPGLQWEIGPGINTENFFAFSPNHNTNLLVVTKGFASSAPKIENWEFLPAKPRKNWFKRIIKIGQKDHVIEVDLDSWKYNLTSFKDGEFFDVNLLPINCENLTENHLSNIGNMLVQFELGELMFMELVDRVNIINSGSPNEPNIEIHHLYDQIQDLSKPSEV